MTPSATDPSIGKACELEGDCHSKTFYNYNYESKQNTSFECSQVIHSPLNVLDEQVPLRSLAESIWATHRQGPNHIHMAAAVQLSD